MPAQMKSAPFSKAYWKAACGGMAPAASTLKAIHGIVTSFMKSTSPRLGNDVVVVQLAADVEGLHFSPRGLNDQ
jgi:hypothetical protein